MEVWIYLDIYPDFTSLEILFRTIFASKAMCKWAPGSWTWVCVFQDCHLGPPWQCHVANPGVAGWHHRHGCALGNDGKRRFTDRVVVYGTCNTTLQWWSTSPWVRKQQFFPLLAFHPLSPSPSSIFLYYLTFSHQWIEQRGSGRRLCVQWMYQECPLISLMNVLTC